ncbi:hypothetical protein ACLOJK_039592 [Asimina triloba]
MASQVPSCLLHSTLAMPTAGEQEDVKRHTADFHPSVWGDYFLNFSQDTQSLMCNAKDSEQEIELINDLQRLGVAYKFEEEIEEALHRIYVSYSSIDYNDLSIVALRFRLLRQEGYNVSPGIKFKFETYLGTHGEEHTRGSHSFHKANIYRPPMPHLDHHLARQVGRALELPMWKRIKRIEIRDYISVYEDDVSRNNVLLELAKVALFCVWKGIDVAKKLHYARDRVAELYLWILAIYFEPKYSRARLIMTKMIGLFSLIDDTYDAYGTLEELEPFSDVIQRWDVGSKNQLPGYMQVLFQAIVDTMDEIAGLLTPEESSYRVRYLRESATSLSKYGSAGAMCPPLDEYLHTALITCGYFSLTICSFGGMDQLATEDAFEWAMQFPKIIKASSVVNRMLDDIQSRQFEQKRGHVASGIDCYVKDYGVSEEEACNKFEEMVRAAWKDMNEEWLKPSPDVPRALLIRPIYLACVMEVLFMHADEYTPLHR